MTPSPNAKHYANVLYDTAVRLGCVQSVADEMPLMQPLIEACGEYLAGPLVDTGVLSAAMREILPLHFCGLTVAFIVTLAERHHLHLLSNAAQQFININNHESGRRTVMLRVPYWPDDGMLDRLKRRLAEEGLFPAECAEKTGFEITIDTELIGGFVAYCDGYQIDASIKTSLRRLRHPERFGWH